LKNLSEVFFDPGTVLLLWGGVGISSKIRLVAEFKELSLIEKNAWQFKKEAVVSFEDN
jgi:hypothetical protein